jgi:predicted dithiol-disulfide oxidoreductase (DUF899 family)
MATSLTEVHQAKAVPHEKWIEARKELLAKEKEFTRQRDEVSRLRRELPWEKVEQDYVFDGPRGKEKLSDLFDCRSQLIVYHFMFGPGWSEGCPGCSHMADHFDGITIHLAHRDATLVAVSRGPLDQIQAFKKRMGWKFHWVSSFGSDFNFDYGVSFKTEDRVNGKVSYNYGAVEFPADEAPGLSVFFKEENGDIYHTYSTYARGVDILLDTYNFLDMTPKGRDEDALKMPMSWLRHHDKYADAYFVDPEATWEHPKSVDPSSCCSEQHS